ncbi:MAG: galactose-1-phosphate uridylyltransferase [bacterium]
MPELRKDPVLGRWVIVATERARRPSDFVPPPEASEPEGRACPFCAGNEAMTPPEVLSYTEGERWLVRVVPNRFPALVTEGEAIRQGSGIYDRMSGIGAHEVIVETPDHSQRLSDLPPDRVELVLRAFKSRAEDLGRDARIRYIMVFKNEGASAGASLSHSHSQLIATPVIPVLVKEEIAGARRYHDFRGRCVFCDMVKQELTEAARLVDVNDGFVAFAPWAPRFPFETWVVARDHYSSWGSLDDSRLADLARLLKSVIGRIARALSRPDYNIVFHAGPTCGDDEGHYHFHVEILPKLSKIAGFEAGTGFYINPVPPEDAARYLREVGCS